MENDSNNKSNITIGHPKAGGAIFWAPLGTTLPTSATEELDSAFQNLGYVTEDGVTISTEEESDTIKAWGPEDVIVTQTSYGKTVNLNLMETARESVLKFVYGDKNVTKNSNGSFAWDDTGEPLPRGVFIVDTLQNNGSAEPRFKRQIFGDSQFVDRSGDHVYNDTDPVAFPIVVKAYKFRTADNKDTYVRTYLSAPATPSA